MNWRKSLTTGHGRANRRMLSIFLPAFSVTRMAIWIQVAVNAPVECDDVSSVGVLEFLDVARHPIASECCLEDLGYNSVSTDLIAGCHQDRRMKDNVLIEGGYRSGKIASFQRAREGSLCHSSVSHRAVADIFWPMPARRRHADTENARNVFSVECRPSTA
jgi:hypothetical protein